MWTSWALLAHRRAETTKEEEEIEEMEEEEEQCVFLSSLPLSSSDSETFIACRRHGTVHSQRRSDRALCWGVGGRKKNNPEIPMETDKQLERSQPSYSLY